MKKYGSMLVFILFVFFIQVNVFQEMDLLRTSPNLLLIIVAGYGFTRGYRDGMIAGICSGLLMDGVFGTILGFYTLPYMYIGFACGFFRRYFKEDNYLIPGLLSGISDGLMGVYIFVFSFALRNRLNFPFYLNTIILPEVVYTVLMSLIVFRIQVLHNQLVDKWIKKRGRRIVKRTM